MHIILLFLGNLRLNLTLFWLLPVAFIFSHSGCKHTEEVSMANEKRYKHNLFSDEDECRRLNPNREISCYETVTFNEDGQADILIAGSDVFVRSSYINKGDTILIEKSPGLYKSINFVKLTESELLRIDDNTKWIRY